MSSPDHSLETLSSFAAQVLNCANPIAKAKLSRQLYSRLQQNPDLLRLNAQIVLPDVPAREERPLLMMPKDMPKRRISSHKVNRFALLHALAHIELNAINLAWDIAARFANISFPADFYWDWLKVADDESKHFLLLQERLEALGGTYGDLPAHDGLWVSAQATHQDALARLAVVPMVLEARGLDVTPGMIAKFKAIGDDLTVAALKVIYEDEVTHVAAGRRWFEWLAKQQRHNDIVSLWQQLVKEHFQGILKRPFNVPARWEAGMQPQYYVPLADWYETLDLEDLKKES